VVGSSRSSRAVTATAVVVAAFMNCGGCCFFFIRDVCALKSSSSFRSAAGQSKKHISCSPRRTPAQPFNLDVQVGRFKQMAQGILGDAIVGLLMGHSSSDDIGEGPFHIVEGYDADSIMQAAAADSGLQVLRDDIANNVFDSLNLHTEGQRLQAAKCMMKIDLSSETKKLIEKKAVKIDPSSLPDKAYVPNFSDKLLISDTQIEQKELKNEPWNDQTMGQVFFVQRIIDIVKKESPTFSVQRIIDTVKGTEKSPTIIMKAALLGSAASSQKGFKVVPLKYLRFATYKEQFDASVIE